MTRRRVAIVGAGIGGEHLTGYLANPDRFDVATICDLDAGRAEALVSRACAAGSDAHYARDLDTVLADDRIDIIDVCLPPQLHKTAILAALEHGRHVVCEKPLVASLAEVDDIERALANSDRLLMPVFQYRFGNGLSQLVALSDAGLLGTVLVATLETHWNRQADYYAVDWRGKWATELGGAVVGHAIHAHDLLSRVLGPISSVQASLATRVNPIETEDCAAIVFVMASGALVTSSVTLGSADDRSRLRFCFDKLSAESGLDPYNPATGPWEFRARAPASQQDIDTLLANCSTHAEGYARQFALFDEALAGRSELPVSLADARTSLELVTAIYQSAATGQRVRLPLADDAPGYADWTQGRRALA